MISGFSCYVVLPCQFDVDCSATIDSEELRRVFESLGIHLNFLQVFAVMSAADNDKRCVSFQF
jgi:Ca2+-binding EF-hand superfamily protein